MFTSTGGLLSFYVFGMFCNLSRVNIIFGFHSECKTLEKNER